jgi:hypothetical protein
MSNTTIGRWVGMAMIAGLMATSTAVEAQSVPEETASFNGMTIPVKSIESFKQNPDKKWEMTLAAGGGVIKSDHPPVFSSSVTPGTPPDVPALQPKSGLTNVQENLIRGELEAMVTHGSDQSASSLRARLRDRAEEMAEAFLRIGRHELYQDSSLLSKLQDLVRVAMIPYRPPIVSPPVGPKWRSSSSGGEPIDDESRSRCECMYCHPLHQAGTCSLPYAPMTVPVLPAAVSYAPAMYYAYPSGQKHRHLHGAFCTCSWCRRW